jgi:V8-like Glu-specific endopeptidase
MRARITGTLVVLIAMMSMVATAVAAPSERGDEARSEHQRVIDYWTAERVASAIPREMVRPGGPIAPQAKPPGTPGGGGNGGGGGGGDDGTVTVTGAHWTKGGAVRSTTGKVLFTLGTSNYVCSGSLVNDSLNNRSVVLTAGHCMYDDRNNSFASNWIFYPDYESHKSSLTTSCSAEFCFVAERLVTTTQWRDGDFEHDYGFAVLKPNSKNVLAESYGTQSIAFDRPALAHVYAFGYPHATPYDGTRLIYCAGNTKPDPYGSTTQGVGCDMTGGSSGGPWFAGFNATTGEGVLYSVNSYKYRNDKKTMYGPQLGAGAELAYDNANDSTASGNDLVTAP